jgi:hypothetical protein
MQIFHRVNLLKDTDYLDSVVEDLCMKNCMPELNSTDCESEQELVIARAEEKASNLINSCEEDRIQFLVSNGLKVL